MKKYVLSIFILVFSMFTIFGQEDVKLFEQAQWRFRSGDFEIALEHYEQLIRKYPLSDFIDDAQFRRGVCLFKLDKHSESLRVFRRVESRYLSTKYYSLLPFWIGISSYKLDDYNLAEQLLTDFISSNFEQLLRESYLYLALAQKKQGKFQKALDNVLKLTDLNLELTDDPVSFSLALSLMIELEQYQEAIDLVDNAELKNLDSDNQDNINFYKAEAFYNLEQSEEAEAIYVLLTKSTVNNLKSLAYQRLFSVYTKQRKNAKLEKLITDAEIELQSNREFLDLFWTTIAIDKFNKKDYESVQVYLLKIWNSTDIKNLDDLIPLYLAESFFKTEKFDRAIEVLASYLSFIKDDKQIFYFRLSDSYLRTGDWENAYKYAVMVENASSHAYSAALVVATALINLEQYQEAVSFLEEYAANNPGYAALPELLKLRAEAYRKNNNLEQSSSLFFQYLEKNSNDEKALYNYMIVNFKLNRYGECLNISKRVEEVAKSRYRILTNYYVRGLSQIALGQYNSSLESLGKITLLEMKDLGLYSLVGYVRFYRAWAAYRLGMYEDSYNIFLSVNANEVSSDLYVKSSYYAGWAAFSLGKYELAAESFEKYSAITSGLDSEQGKFLQAKSLVELGDYKKAESIYVKLSNTRNSAYAEDAKLDYANMLSTMGSVEKAVTVLEELIKDFPTSNHIQYSAFRVGEILFLDHKFEDARKAFYDYRHKYPKGKYLDASLYWGGMSSFMLGASNAALLLWDQLYAEHKDSIFLPDTIARMAEIYLDKKDWDKSQEFFKELLMNYPEAAISVSADTQLQRIDLLKQGKYDKEAEILANIRSKGGLKTRAGREAMLELGDLYINIYSDAKKREQAFEDMLALVEVTANEAETRGRAYFLIANYYYKKNDFKNAGDYYLLAANEKVTSSSFSAESLYMAVKTAVVAGKQKDAQAVFKIMKDKHPSSQWTESASKLLE